MVVMGPERLVKRVYDSEMEGGRERGRPRKQWNDNFTHLTHYQSLSSLVDKIMQSVYDRC